MTLLTQARKAGLDVDISTDSLNAQHPNGQTYTLRTREDVEHMSIELGLVHNEHIRVGQIWASNKPNNIRTGSKQSRTILAIKGDHVVLTSDADGITPTVSITTTNGVSVVNAHRLVSEGAPA